MSMLTRQLYRSRRNRIILGVAGGLSEFTGIDANLLRLLWLFSIFLGGFGLFIYLAMALIIPTAPEGYVVSPATISESWQALRNRSGAVLGAVLVLFGFWLLLKSFDLIPYSLIWIWSTFWRLFWPLLLIGTGVILVIALNNREASLASIVHFFRNRRSGRTLARSRSDRLLAGVCGGIAQYLEIPSSTARLLWVIASIATVGMGAIAYVVAVASLPLEGQGALATPSRATSPTQQSGTRRYTVTIDSANDK